MWKDASAESVVNQGATQEPTRRSNWADKKTHSNLFYLEPDRQKKCESSKKGVKIEFSYIYRVGQDPSDKSNRFHVHIFRFCCFHLLEAYSSIDSSKMIGNSLSWSLQLQPVISQPQPVHVQLTGQRFNQPIWPSLAKEKKRKERKIHSEQLNPVIGEIFEHNRLKS